MYGLLGQGANQALLDALSLAKSIYRSFDPESLFPPIEKVSNALSTYESEMLERSQTKVKASAEAAHFLHTNVAIMEGNVTRGAAADQKSAIK